MVPVSNDTLLWVGAATGLFANSSSQIVGIDDWAFHRSRRYGTIACGLERRRIVTLLPIVRLPP
ncbi:hypothetical protein [Mesorhizobium sp. M0701]|uniref:hypothetical protein n=1 Tax=Mesorhizobium sp. M0701 TaxID=2956989 RepID=UPI00333DA716